MDNLGMEQRWSWNKEGQPDQPTASVGWPGRTQGFIDVPFVSVFVGVFVDAGETLCSGVHIYLFETYVTPSGS